MQTSMAAISQYCMIISEESSAHFQSWSKSVDLLIGRLREFKDDEQLHPRVKAAQAVFQVVKFPSVLEHSEMTLQEFTKAIVDLTRIDSSKPLIKAQQAVLESALKVRFELHENVFMPKDYREVEKIRELEAKVFWQNLNTVANTRIFVIPSVNCSQEDLLLRVRFRGIG